MKKMIFSFLLVFFLVAALPADNLFLGEVPFLNLSQDSFDEFRISYETDNDEYEIRTYINGCSGKVILTSEQFKSLQETFSKILDWCKIAHENKAEVDKEVPNSNIQARAEWSWGYTTYRNAGWTPVDLRFLFTAAEGKGENGIVTLLLIAAPVVTSSYSEDITYRFPSTLLTEENINKFMNVISQENIDLAIKKHEDSKKAEDLFN